MDKLDLILQKIESIDDRMDRMETELVKTRDTLNARINEVKVEIEGKIFPSIRIIAEGHLDLARNLNTVIEMKPSQEELAIRVSALEYTVSQIKKTIVDLKAVP